MRRILYKVWRVVRFNLRLLATVVVALLLGVPAAGATAVLTYLDLPVPKTDLPEQNELVVAYPSEVFDVNGDKIATYRGFDETVDVEYEDLPQHLIDAFVAIEDRRFWEHSGFDLEGIARAAQTNANAGYVKEGGSTITQQYVKNAYLNNERSLERKLDEALLAVELEKVMGKEDILLGYLNISYFGSGAYGIGAAAEIYFGKSVADLDISEAATLAGIVKAPSSYSPTSNLELAEERRLLVLSAMEDVGYLDSATAEDEKSKELWLLSDGVALSTETTHVRSRPAKGSADYPFIADWIEEVLLEELGDDAVYRGGLRIETTIDPNLQAAAEDAVAARLENTEAPVDMSLVSVDPETGFVKAMVAGRDYDASQVNLALGGSTGFQPGSSFKPLVLATAFEKGFSPESVYPAPAQWASPGCVGDCFISNYDNAGYGEMTLRSAMHSSVNTVFAQLVIDVSIEQTVELGRALGLSRLDPSVGYGASFALGAAETSPLEMASAYGTFANSGVYMEPTAILRVLDREGNVLIDNRVRSGDRVMTAATADNVTDVLTGVVDGGTGGRAAIGRPVAGKTGTAQAYRAAWFVGYTPQLATAVWMGHSDGQASLRGINGVGNVTGGSHPAIAFADFNRVAHADLPVEQFPTPAEIEPPDEESVETIKASVAREFTIAASQNSPSVFAETCGTSSCTSRQVRLPEIVAAEPAVVEEIEQVIEEGETNG